MSSNNCIWLRWTSYLVWLGPQAAPGTGAGGYPARASPARCGSTMAGSCACHQCEHLAPSTPGTPAAPPPCAHWCPYCPVLLVTALLVADGSRGARRSTRPGVAPRLGADLAHDSPVPAAHDMVAGRARHWRRGDSSNDVSSTESCDLSRRRYAIRVLASSLGASLSRKPWNPWPWVAAFSRSWRGSSSLWRRWSSVKAQGDASRALVPWLGRARSPPQLVVFQLSPALD